MVEDFRGMHSLSWPRSRLISNRKSRQVPGHFLGLILLGLAWGGAAVPGSSLADAQANTTLHLPVIWRGPDRIAGEVLAVHTLATAPDLVLVEINGIGYMPPQLPYESFFSRDGGGHWQSPVAQPWLDAVSPPITAVRHTLIAGQGGPLLVAGATFSDGTSQIENRIYFSQDYGDTWVRRLVPAVPGCPELLFSDFRTTAARPGRLYVVLNCRDTLFGSPATLIWLESDDAGLTWSMALGPNEVQPLTLLSQTQADRIFRVRRGRKLERSDDAGATWQDVGAVPMAILEVTLGDPDRLLAETFEGAFVSADSGATWRALGHFPCQLHVEPFFAEVPGQAPLDLVRCADGHLIATSDLGTTWLTLPPRAWPVDHNLLAQQDAAVSGRLWVFTLGAGINELWRLDLNPVTQWTPVLVTTGSRY